VAPHITSKRPSLTYTAGKLTAPAAIPKDRLFGQRICRAGLGGRRRRRFLAECRRDNSAVHSAELLVARGASVPIPPPPPPAAKRIIRVGFEHQSTAAGSIRSNPDYPILAKQTHVSGTVVVTAVLDEHGKRGGSPRFERPSVADTCGIEGRPAWKYEPTLLNGTPVAVEMEVTVHFSLGS